MVSSAVTLIYRDAFPWYDKVVIQCLTVRMNMSNPITGIRIDPTVKDKAQKIFETKGISFSAAVNIFLHETVNRGNLPIEFAKEKADFVELYLSPIRNERFRIDSAPKTATYLRNRLSKRKAFIYGQ